MAEGGSKGLLSIAGDYVKGLPPLPSLLIFLGSIFCAIAVIATLTIKDVTVAAESEKWRTVAAVIGGLLIVSGLVFQWREPRTPLKKTPGPFAAPNFPVKTAAPADTVIVVKPDQTVTVKGTKTGPAWPDCEVWLMHVDDQKIVPRYDKMTARVAGNEYSWEVPVRLPDPDRIGKEDVWELAFYYVGPNGRRLLRLHRDVSTYFSPQGVEKKWPMFERWPGEMEQCSEIVRIKFDSVQRHSWSENRRPGTTANPYGPGDPNGGRNVMPGANTPVGVNPRPGRSGDGFNDLLGGNNAPVGGNRRPGSASGTGLDDAPRSRMPGSPTGDGFEDAGEKRAPGERVLYDGVKEMSGFHFNGQGERFHEDAVSKPIGQGSLTVDDNQIRVVRRNTGGRYRIILTNYVVDGKAFDYLPKNPALENNRRLKVTCEARVSGGTHKLGFSVKAFEDFQMFSRSDFDEVGTEWRKIVKFLTCEPTANVRLWIEDQEVSQADTTISIRRLVLSEG